MPPRKINIQFGERKSSYEISISHDRQSHAGKWVRACIGSGARKAIVVSNPTVFDLYGDELVESLELESFDAHSWLMPDGEAHKSLENVALALEAFSDRGLARTDVVVALGGGVVGDLAGFVASIYLRGVDLVQMPTTLLSMIDSSVGGKTGVNSPSGKNLIGAFYQPCGVMINTNTLRTLPQREVTAGLCEAVKHGVLSGPALFDQTRNFLEQYPAAVLEPCFQDPDGLDSLDQLIEAQVSFKASIVKLDERESAGRTDGRSRKVLNFGHTLGHALEKVTKYAYLRHGEAVGYGMLFAAELSKKLDIIASDEVDLLYDVVHRTGPLPPIAHIDPEEVLEAFRFDKKIVAGSLQLILLEGIGKPCIVEASSIPQPKLLAALEELVAKTTI